ncbi:NAD(P)H-binding protein [Streptomyces sp. NPDC050997]|uniref:NAD(P)H-binding protein n=1 Tax=Streptomyces sp. NPDC050997 TaxID=3155519 RepID=UPI00342BCB91
MTVLVTGGRGHVARAVVDRLLADGRKVRVASRRPEEAVLPAGVEVVKADLSDPDTLPGLLDGVSKVFLYAEPKGIDGFVAAAEESGSPHIVVLSASGVEAGDPATDPIVRMHRAAENALRESRLSWTFLRPGAFSTNTLQWAYEIRGTGVVKAPFPDAHASAIHESDIADIAVLAMTEPGHEGKAYPLSGPESVTQREQVECISEAIGRKVVLEEITAEEYRDALGRWGDAELVDTLVRHLVEAVGRPAPVFTTYQDLTGEPGRTYADWTVDHADDFR